MLTQSSKNQNRRHVHERIRKKILGTAERPRLNVYRSLNHIYVQLIDDLKGETLIAAHSAEGGREGPAADWRKRRRGQDCGQNHRRTCQG
jgi:large subunit ribosomal protein L18